MFGNYQDEKIGVISGYKTCTTTFVLFHKLVKKSSYGNSSSTYTVYGIKIIDVQFGILPTFIWKSPNRTLISPKHLRNIFFKEKNTLKIYTMQARSDVFVMSSTDNAIYFPQILTFSNSIDDYRVYILKCASKVLQVSPWYIKHYLNWAIAWRSNPAVSARGPTAARRTFWALANR